MLIIGSKNKPKPPIIITRGIANVLRSHLKEVLSDCDVTDSIATFAAHRQRGVCILCATSVVTNVTLHQPASPHFAPREVRDPVALWVISSCSHTSWGNRPLAGGQGQIVGGNVVGPLLASGPVIIMEASFANVAYKRLSLDEEDEAIATVAGMQQGGCGGQSIGSPGRRVVRMTYGIFLFDVNGFGRQV